MKMPTVGAIVHSFFVDHLGVLKGLRPSSIRSYRDALRMFLLFAATDSRRRITRLSLQDLSFERVQSFLRHLEQDRGNHIRTRNQRLTVLRAFFDYLGARVPEMLLDSSNVMLPNATVCATAYVPPVIVGSAVKNRVSTVSACVNVPLVTVICPKISRSVKISTPAPLLAISRSWNREVPGSLKTTDCSADPFSRTR